MSKPDVAFFDKLIEVSGLQPGEIVYVGDRLDNDIAPAAKAGILTALVRRGPWGFILDRRLQSATPDFQVDSLAELPRSLI